MITDHSLERVVFYKFSCEEINEIFIKALNGENINNEEASKYSVALLISLGKMYAERNMVMQLHIGALRNNNIITQECLIELVQMLVLIVLMMEK